MIPLLMNTHYTEVTAAIRAAGDADIRNLYPLAGETISDETTETKIQGVVMALESYYESQNPEAYVKFNEKRTQLDEQLYLRGDDWEDQLDSWIDVFKIRKVADKKKPKGKREVALVKAALSVEAAYGKVFAHIQEEMEPSLFDPKCKKLMNKLSKFWGAHYKLLAHEGKKLST